MLTYTQKAGTTDVSVVIRIVDSTDGTPETGVVFNTSGIDLEYRREGAASTDLTEATLAALTTAHTDGGFLHIGNGYYRVDLPDAAVASGVSGVLVHGTVTGMVVIGCYVQLVAYDPFDTVRLGLTALPTAAAEAAGGLYTRGTGAGQVNQPANGMLDANTVRFGGTAGTFASGRPEVNTTHAAGTAWGSGAITAASIASDAITDAKVASDVTIASVTGAVGSVTGAVGSVTGNVGGNVTGSIGSVASGGITAASIAAAAFTSAKFHADTGLVPIRSNTAAAGAATTITLDASASALDDFYNNCLILIISGTGAGQARFIPDYVGATKVASVRTWVTNPDNTSVFVILGSDATSAGLVADAVLDDALADSIPADGALPTVRQALYMICQYLMERSVSGTTVTVRKVDGSTALMTFTLSDATSPTSITRTT